MKISNGPTTLILLVLPVVFLLVCIIGDYSSLSLSLYYLDVILHQYDHLPLLKLQLVESDANTRYVINLTNEIQSGDESVEELILLVNIKAQIDSMQSSIYSLDPYAYRMDAVYLLKDSIDYTILADRIRRSRTITYKLPYAHNLLQEF